MTKLKEAEDKYKEVEERTHDVIKEISDERDKYKSELNNERSREIIEIRQKEELIEDVQRERRVKQSMKN